MEACRKDVPSRRCNIDPISSVGKIRHSLIEFHGRDRDDSCICSGVIQISRPPVPGSKNNQHIFVRSIFDGTLHDVWIGSCRRVAPRIGTNVSTVVGCVDHGFIYPSGTTLSKHDSRHDLNTKMVFGPTGDTGHSPVIVCGGRNRTSTVTPMVIAAHKVFA